MERSKQSTQAVVDKAGRNDERRARESLRRHFEAAVSAGDEQEWGRAKLMVVGQGKAGKTSTVRSLLGMAPVDEHLSTVGVELTVTRAAEFVERAVGESDFDLLANQAAAKRAAAKRAGKEGAQDKRTSSRAVKRISQRVSGMVRVIRNSISGVEKVVDAKESSPGGKSEKAARKLLDDNQVAVRFDFEAIKRLTSTTSSGTPISFNIWDYGGQEVFYALHHIFLTQQGLYLVVFNMCKLLQKPGKSIRFLKFWLYSITLHAPNAPILLIGSHLDKIGNKELESVNEVLRDQLKLVSFKTVVKNTTGRLFFFPIDNSLRDPTRGKLIQDTVLSVTRSQKYIQERVPLAWLRVLDDLLEQKDPYLSFARVCSIGQEFGLSRSDVDKMLGKMHELGVVYHQRGTERLSRVVVTKPQWLLDKLSSVISDKMHVRDKYFDQELSSAGLEEDWANLRQSGVSSRTLLEHLWGGEQVDYLIDFMRDTMLLSDWKFESGKFLISSIIQSGDAALDFSDIQGGLACELHFEFLPTGVFQRIVSLCTEYGNSSVEPDLCKNQAIFCFSDFFGLVQSDDKTIRVMVSPRADKPAEIIKVVVSMYNELSYRLMNDLKFTLTLESPTDKVQAKYQDLSKARSQQTKKIRAFERKMMVNVDDYAVFFDDSVGALDSDADGPQAEILPPLDMSCGFKHHVFLSHKQSSGADIASSLSLQLQSRGLKVWYDQEFRGNLAVDAMKCGIRDSTSYLLLLTKDVFQSGAVRMELETAVTLKKPILLVHEDKRDQASFCEFYEYIQSVPDFAKHLFDKIESMPLRRRYYEKKAFLEELVGRILNHS